MFPIAFSEEISLVRSRTTHGRLEEKPSAKRGDPELGEACRPMWSCP
jgi:hypothetical protein